MINYVAMKNKKLSKIRKKLDTLDDALLRIIKKRTSLVKQVLKLKTSKNQIIDKKRIKVILKNIKRKSVKKNMEPKLSEEIWKGIIRSYIKYEFKNFKKK